MSVAPTSNGKAIDVSLLIMRLIVGTIFAAHGSQHLFGTFHGPGLTETVKALGFIGYLVAVGEFFGGIGIFFGFLARFSAASIIVIMIGAIAKVHFQNGFFMQNGGFEYNLALIGLLLPILIIGAGRYAVGVKLPKWAR
jgi:putative oxidoreductase